MVILDVEIHMTYLSSCAGIGCCSHINLGQQLFALHIEIFDWQFGYLFTHFVVMFDGMPRQTDILGKIVTIEILLQIIYAIGHITGLPREIFDRQPYIGPLLMIIQLLAIKIGRQLMRFSDLIERFYRNCLRLKLVLIRTDRGALLLPKIIRFNDHHVMYIRTEMLLQYLQYCLHIRRAVAIAAHVNDDCEAEILGRIAASER